MTETWAPDTTWLHYKRKLRFDKQGRFGYGRSCLGDGLLWFLLDEEGSMSFLFTRSKVEIEVWPQWAKNPATWRKRFPGESVGITVPNS